MPIIILIQISRELRFEEYDTASDWGWPKEYQHNPTDLSALSAPIL